MSTTVELEWWQEELDRLADQATDLTPGPRGGSRCGTYGGYQAHRKHGQTACDACRVARNTYVAEWRAGRRRALAACGTYAAFCRHRKRGEPIDDACEQAGADYERARARRRRRTAGARMEAQP